MVKEIKSGNETYKISVLTPLLRPGLVIETETSAPYALPAMESCLAIARAYNKKHDPERNKKFNEIIGNVSQLEKKAEKTD